MKLIITLFSLFLTGVTLNLNGQESPVFTIESAKTTASNSTVSITTADFSNIGSGNLKITYDPDVVNPTGVIKGPGLGGTLDVNLANPGVIVIGWFTFPGVTLTDGSVVFDIVFEHVNPGTSAISFDETSGDTDCQFYDTSSQKLNDEPFGTYYKSGSLSFNEQVSPVTTAPFLTAEESEDIDVPVTVTDFNNIGAVSLRLEYDPAVLSYNSADNIPVVFRG